MFERRLKVFLFILLLVTLTLILRAAQVQVLQHKNWEKLATDALTRAEQVETRRGTIRDNKGVVIAVDEPCVDVCLDYRALAPESDKDWPAEVARARLVDRMGSAFTGAKLEQRKAMLAKEVERARDDIRQTIPRLAKICGRKEEELEDVRQATVEKVRMQRRFLWYYNYAAALEKHETGEKQAETRPSPGWMKWLLDDAEDPPELDKFELRVAEESSKHVIVRDIDLDVQTELGKHSDRFPGLELRTGNRRIYPLGRAGAHVLGRLSKVTREDMGTADPYFFNKLRRYQLTDLKGRGGLEGLCEPVLRGDRGEIAHVQGNEASRRKPEPGGDVYTSIDIELQQQVEALFDDVPVPVPDSKTPDRLPMHGAAVVIDVKSGEIRVLASAPGFDPNRVEEELPRLTSPANLEKHLLNRATQALREPGSTIKPLVGTAGVASGIRRPDEGFECTGYLVIDGKPMPSGRCWVASMFHKVLCRPDCTRFPCPTVAHHPIGNGYPHPTGLLTLPDALERSCNPYFESIANALGPVRLSEWYHKFGLGTPTYVGIAESSGRVPVDFERLMRGPGAKHALWSSGIGQGPVAVTPLQMANVAATIARGGVWVRPKLLRQGSPPNYPAGTQDRVPPTTQLANRVDLGIPPEALRAVREGMIAVVNGRSGSGDSARRKDVLVAGKTGTAEAAPLQVPRLDAGGKVIKTGRMIKTARGQYEELEMETLQLSTHDVTNPRAPWYRATGREGDQPHHSWFIGFAPAEDPQIAFAVMVEYGGSGGAAAGSVASRIIELCIGHRYLIVEPKGDPVASTQASVPAVASPLAAPAEVELLHEVSATTRAAAQ